mmetsp:Transcript_6978/g.14851  ORF Transcript_6978/g.14851 Transcript_6978/m.14851 type:complete len:81 (+) Transcript_6978:547-789(+)
MIALLEKATTTAFDSKLRTAKHAMSAACMDDVRRNGFMLSCGGAYGMLLLIVMEPVVVMLVCFALSSFFLTNAIREDYFL